MLCCVRVGGADTSLVSLAIMAGAYQKKYRKLIKEVNSWMCDNDDFNDASLQNKPDKPDDCTGITGLCSGTDAVSTSACAEPVVFDSDIPPLSSEDELESSADDLRSDLARWAMDARTTREDCNALLALLRKHGYDLSKDRRTLPHTPEWVDAVDVCGGQ